MDIRLKPLFKFRAASENEVMMALENRFDDKKMESFISSMPLPVRLTARQEDLTPNNQKKILDEIDKKIQEKKESKSLFAKALIESGNKQFNTALECYNQAIDMEPDQTFYYINRGALQSEMIDFISSIESNVQVLTLATPDRSDSQV